LEQFVIFAYDVGSTKYKMTAKEFRSKIDIYIYIYIYILILKWLLAHLFIYLFLSFALDPG